MQYYQSTSAYDFDYFSQKEDSTPDLSLIRGDKYNRRDRMTIVRLISSVLVVIAVICVMLYSRAQLTELTNQIGKFDKEYNELRSQYTRISAEIEGKVSLRGVEESAKELGLDKVQSYQVEYVNIETQESFAGEGAPAPEPSIGDQISLYIGSFLEYINPN